MNKENKAVADRAVDVLDENEDRSSEEEKSEKGENAPAPEKRKKRSTQSFVVKNPKSGMVQFSAEVGVPPEEGELVDGKVIHVGKSALYLDLHPYGTGIIYGREFLVARDLIKKINIGDMVNAKVIDPENEDGYIELSLKEARRAILWSEAEDHVKQKTPLELLVKDANKGGLLIDWQGLTGFLPASQLKPEHYPRVEDGNKDRILEELKKLVGERLPVVIIAASPREEKLIFSEKSYAPKETQEAVSKYQVGEIVEGVATGVVDFGIFVKVEEGLEGLVHISEIDWGLVEDPRNLYKQGDKIRAKIIEATNDKISLSIKALKENPWKNAAEKYKKGDEVTAVVIKFNKHGVLASIEEGVAGLVHVSEFGSMEKLRETFELGKTYPFKITLFNPKEQKMTLSPVEKGKEK
ncbi:MAG TPA: S1 RNA-binding domain-containing protein [Candidatus Paceibacterota bacterium]|nr:S1 RNA-binding domain-containing protein [Candidatus Paceibacterota bacterium]